jgi:ubiquinone/menaquinone biosynthesis C-methylase UbiE
MHEPDPTCFDPARARHYDNRHRESMIARFITWRERKCVSKALYYAGSPVTALDLPCGTGRFWPAFAGAGVIRLIAADNSADMLEVAEHNRIDEEIPRELLKCSAFSIALPDNSVEISICLRFFHRLAMGNDRRILLDELKRVSSSGYVLLSTMVSGNLVGNRKIRKKAGAATPGYGRRFVRTPADVDAEFLENGFRIVRHYDSVPGIDCWRFYLLHEETQTVRR